MASYQSMRMASQAKDNEEKKVQERKKALLVLICRHLCDYGYIESANQLQTEGGVSLQNVDAADNIDLLNVLQEYEDFYEIRFQRRPKLTRKVGAGDQRTAAEQAKLPNINKIGANGARRKPSLSARADDDVSSDAPSTKPSSAPGSGPGRPPRGSATGAHAREHGRRGNASARVTRAGLAACAGRAPPGGDKKGPPPQDDTLGLNITSSKAVVVEGTRAEAEAKFRKGGGGGGGQDGEGDPAEFWERRCVCVCLCVSVCVCVCLCVCARMRAPAVCVCMYACVHVCMHACMYVCMYAGIHTRTYARTNTRVRASSLSLAHTRMHTHTHGTHTCMHTVTC